MSQHLIKEIQHLKYEVSLLKEAGNAREKAIMDELKKSKSWNWMNPGPPEHDQPGAKPPVPPVQYKDEHHVEDRLVQLEMDIREIKAHLKMPVDPEETRIVPPR